MKEIKNCPHCGGEAIMYANYAARTHSYMIFVKCGICGATGKTTAQREDPEATGWESDACTRALEAWNMRTPARKKTTA